MATSVPPVVPDPDTAAILTTALAAGGLEPWMMFAGLVGGWWSLIYLPKPVPWHSRLGLSLLSTFVGAWGGGFVAPPLAALAAWHQFTRDWWPAEAGGRGLRIVASLIIGLLAHRQIGPLLMRRAEKAAE
jgi:hypothetical protein